MPEMLTPTSAIMGAGLGNDVALLTDGRFSGGSHVYMFLIFRGSLSVIYLLKLKKVAQ